MAKLHFRVTLEVDTDGLAALNKIIPLRQEQIKVIMNGKPARTQKIEVDARVYDSNKPLVEQMGIKFKGGYQKRKFIKTSSPDTPLRLGTVPKDGDLSSLELLAHQTSVKLLAGRKDIQRQKITAAVKAEFVQRKRPISGVSPVISKLIRDGYLAIV